MQKTLLDGFGEATEQVIALRAENEQLKRERDQAREHRDYVTGQQWDAVAAWEGKVEDLTKLAQSYLTELSEERVRCAKAEDEVERYQALLRETLNLWSVEVERLRFGRG